MINRKFYLEANGGCFKMVRDQKIRSNLNKEKSGGGLITDILKRLSFRTYNNRIFLRIGENILY